ncbi:hypothetical protein EOD42_24890 [Rhodovarius crocodyli]|uniref:YjbF family lipoprotein n=1 Tax=Rhodovarius crocodyli TaxID=1979269 RepID=A0A437LWD9_9PROT|nr:YjbF family lipoprotein [Rhodovarius crocodyli]RVT89637.1 hypothetical protein EOD42_24890 [Rhodovarius crocodyli]
MRPWLPVLLLLPLSLPGCGGSSADPLSEGSGLSAWLPANPFRDIFAPNPLADPWSGAAEDESDGPALRMTLGRRSAGARLVHQQGARQMWRTRSGVVVALDGARVVATSGLPTMLAATRFDGPDPLAEPLRLRRRAAETRRVIDLATASRDPAGMRFGITLQCRLVASTQLAESEAAPEAESPAETGWLLVTERCRAQGLRQFTSRFWADPQTGEMLFSEQWIGPGLAPLRLRHQATRRSTPAADEPDEAPAGLPEVPGPEPAEPVIPG